MAPPSNWLDGRIASTPEEVRNGDGRHPDKAKALLDYLGNSITREEASERMTEHILNENKPADEIYRLWGLLCDAMVELDEEDRTKTLDLLSQIRKLPASPEIDWAQLPGLGNMFHDSWMLHLHGPDRWEKHLPTDEETIRIFRRDFDAIGRADSEMLVRGFPVTCEWVAYKVLDFTLSERAGLDIFMSEIFARLNVARSRLKEKAESEKWMRWKEALLRLSQEGSRLSKEGRRLAAQCHGLL